MSLWGRIRTLWKLSEGPDYLVPVDLKSNKPIHIRSGIDLAKIIAYQKQTPVERIVNSA